MSRYSYEVICPKCKNIINDRTIAEQEADIDQIVLYLEGTCEHCGTDCTWEEVYEYTGCRNIEEE